MKELMSIRNMIKHALKGLNYSASFVGSLLRQVRILGPKRRSKLSDRDKQLIEENCKNKWTDQGASLRSLERILRQAGTSVCKETIRKHINKQPWGKLRKQLRSFYTSAKNKADRLAFACRLNDLGLLKPGIDENFAKTIFFSDEKYFYLTHKPNPQNHRYRGDVSQLKIQRVPKFDSKLLVCAGFSYGGATPILFLDGTVNTAVYKDTILPFYKTHFYRTGKSNNVLENEMFADGGKFFMQDGAKPHTSKASIDYIINEFPDYFHDWPGNSPDLNPIENLWAIVQAKVDEYPFAENLPELRRRIINAWQELKPTELQNLALCFPKRIRTILN